MSALQSFKKKLAAVSRLWAAQDFAAALSEVEALLKLWPGNAHLHILWARLVQLTDNPGHSLADAKRALQQAVELDKDSPAGLIELGHFLDCVEDIPRAAARVFAEGVAVARQALIEGLLGQAKALVQLGKREEARKCLLEVLRNVAAEPEAPFAAQIQELLSELFANRSA